MKTKAKFIALTPLQIAYGAMSHNKEPSMHTFLFHLVVLVVVTVTKEGMA